MKNTISLSAAALFAFLALAPTRSEAGLNFGPTALTASCSKNSDGSGACWGSREAFRRNSDPNAYAYFQVGTAPFNPLNGTFYGYLNGSYSSCSTNSAAMAQRFVELTSHDGFFYIGWDASGICTHVVEYAISYYP